MRSKLEKAQNGYERGDREKRHPPPPAGVITDLRIKKRQVWDEIARKLSQRKKNPGFELILYD